MIIAIDGPSGTGKSTTAREVARKLNFTFFDTGAMYRSAAWWIVQQGINPDDERKVVDSIHTFVYEIQTQDEQQRRYFVGGVDVTQAIRSHEISTIASKIAVYGQLRRELVKIQREFGKKANAVFEGRDMGTVVFPEAEVKVFLTASSSVRAQRRYRELLVKFPDLAQSLSEEQILKDIEERDHKDSTRAISPLKKAPDATLIDTSELTVDEVVDQILVLIRQKKKSCPSMRVTYGFVYWVARLWLKLFYRLQIEGLSHFRAGSAIIAANHASNLDPPIVSISCPCEVHFLAKESLFHIPILGRLIRHLNSHPVSREATDVATFRLIIGLLQSGQKVIVFPEGRRTSDGKIQLIERGLPFLMMKAKCPIQPVYIQGAFEIWPRTRRFPKLFGRIRCVFGSPIEWDEFEGLGKKIAEQRIMSRMTEALCKLQKWTESGAHGTPP